MTVIKIRHMVDPQDVYVRVTCSITGKRFRMGLDGLETETTCRCAREGWKILAEPLPGFLNVRLFKIDSWGAETEVELSSKDIEIDEGD